MVEEHDNDDFLDMVEETETEARELGFPMPGKDEAPSVHSKEWYDFVVDHLFEYELVEGNPTVDGLRRFTDEYFGRIVYSNSKVVTYHIEEGLIFTAMEHKLRVVEYKTGDMLEVNAIIDLDNTRLPAPFNKHVFASADTRAEGKALRRLLKIRTVTAEEASISKDEEDVMGNYGDITHEQQLGITTMCRKLDINVQKITKELYNKAEKLSDLSSLEASSLMNQITSYQRKEVPEELAGYDPLWQKYF